MQSAWGVGLVYWPALHALARDHPDVAVLEVEPQGYWRAHAGSPNGYRLDRIALEAIAGIDKPRLMHSVTLPLADASGLDPDHLALLRQAASILRPAWASEHLSFNRYRRGGRWVDAAFLLPPAMKPETVRLAAWNLQVLSRALELPVAGETGVNYLPVEPNTLADGAFFAGVAEQSDGGLLLDLHNLWCDEANGRARIADTFGLLPLDRVWQVHMAGGWTLDGVLLDAHGGPAPSALEDVLEHILPMLPNVRAVIYEVLPNHLDAVGLDAVARQIERLAGIWRRTKGDALPLPAPALPTLRAPAPSPEELETCARHQDAVFASVASGQTSEVAGLRVYSVLIRDLRASFVAQQLRHTLVLLMLALGETGVRTLLDAYAARAPARPTAEAEALGFADFLISQDIAAPFLPEILAIERAAIMAKTSGTACEITVEADATALLAALSIPQMPDERARGRSVVSLEPA